MRRFPDFIDRAGGVVYEVKNVASLRYTYQLKDYVAYAQQKGMVVELIVRQNTALRPSLVEVLDDPAVPIILSERVLPAIW